MKTYIFEVYPENFVFQLFIVLYLFTLKFAVFL